jgi:hypothetical protein
LDEECEGQVGDEDEENSEGRTIVSSEDRVEEGEEGEEEEEDDG